MNARIFNKILVYFIVIIICIVIFPMNYANASEELGGSCRIVGGMEYGCNVEVNTNDIVTSDSNALLFQWRRDGSDISGATNYSYDIVEEDVGCILTVSVTSSVDNGELIASSQDNKPVRKTYTTVSLPEPPEISDKTHNSITLSEGPISNDEINFYECEYSIYTESCKYKWQDSNVFTNLEPDTTYGFVWRTKETNIYYHSEASEPCYGTTKSAPAILTHNVTNNEKTFNIIKEGYETGNVETLDVIITASGDHSEVTAILVSGDKNSFVIIDGNLASMNDETKTFSIRPILGLAKGTYTANVMISSNEYTKGIGFTITQVIEKETITPIPEPRPLPPKKIRNHFIYKIRDENTGDPIKGAVVKVGSKKYKTNKRGFAYVMLNEDGEFDYSITHDDYITEKGTIDSPEIYSRSTKRFYVNVEMNDNKGPVYYKCLESELLRGKEIFVDFNNCEITGNVTEKDILIKGTNELIVEKINYKKDTLSSMKLILKDYIQKDINDIEIFIDSNKIKNENDNVSTNIYINITNEPNLVLQEKDINRAKIKFVIDNQYFKKTIDKNDIKLTGAPSKLKVKEVIYVSEQIIFIKLEKKADLIDTIKGIKIEVKDSGLVKSKSKSMINLGELTIVSE